MQDTPTRYSLLSRLQNWDDQESWRVFFDTYWRLMYSVAIQSGLTDSEAQDVVQETVISVAKDVNKFKRDRSMGSFKGWLRNLTRWRISDQLRKRGRELAMGAALETCTFEGQMPAGSDANPAELEAVWEREWRANLFAAAKDRVRRRVKEEHFQMFDLNVVKEWPARRIAQTLGVHIGQVYLAKHRIGALIKKELRHLEQELY